MMLRYICNALKSISPTTDSATLPMTGLGKHKIIAESRLWGRLHPFIFDLVNDIALTVAQNQRLHSAKN